MSLKKLLQFMIITIVMVQNVFGEQSLSKEQEFKKSVDELKESPAHFDYLKFRNLYTETKNYKPYTSGEFIIEQKANESIKDKKYDQCITLADEWLNINYTNIKAHFDKYICCKESGDNECASLHKTIVYGLLDSIYASGDGKTPESAYETFNTDELYFFLHANGLVRTKQQVLNKNGRIYDVIDAKHVKSGNNYTIYFDITLQMTNKNDNI